MSISFYSCSADFDLKQIHVIGIGINFKFDILVTTILILGYEASWIRQKKGSNTGILNILQGLEILTWNSTPSFNVIKNQLTVSKTLQNCQAAPKIP
ncbi:unnamed protein product [Caenorhabditis angaria]|uniref:Uncharacterized protein n=1 Tax=Caenorhabditis angaria TaxID=860376 RepID=A0A9P1IIP3_9PELO|nr:unnamed protein product [Caenorhabditis angaria]